MFWCFQYDMKDRSKPGLKTNFLYSIGYIAKLQQIFELWFMKFWNSYLHLFDVHRCSPRCQTIWSKHWSCLIIRSLRSRRISTSARPQPWLGPPWPPSSPPSWSTWARSCPACPPSTRSSCPWRTPRRRTCSPTYLASPGSSDRKSPLIFLQESIHSSQ